MQNEHEVVYRRAQLSDVPALVACRLRFLNELNSHAEDDEARVVQESIRRYFTKAIPSGEFVAWVAELDGELVATSGLVVWQQPARYGGVESGRLGYLLNFYTVPEARRRGIATRLLTEIIWEARSLGLRHLSLHASEAGESIYRKAGFTESSVRELTLRLE
jgi:GNAT superfamily N-acetyltransferase